MEDAGDLNLPLRGSWSDWRQHFPALRRSVYFDTATSGPVSSDAAVAAGRYYQWALEGGNTNSSLWLAEIDACREAIAALIGSTVAEIGFVHNTSMAINCAALIFEGQGAVLTGRGEHPAVSTPWFARGYRVDTAAPDEDGCFTADCYARAIREDTRVICVSHVRYNDGQVNDLQGLGELARAHNLHLVVDGIQSVGIMELDVNAGIDVLGFGSFKWLNAGYGGGAIYVREGILARYGLPLAGNRSRATSELHEITSLEPLLAAQAFELGSVNAAASLALRASLGLIESVGAERIRNRVRALTGRLRSGLQGLGFRTATDSVSDALTPIVAVVVADGEKALAVFQESGVNVALRDGKIRVAVSWYNDERDIDTCLNGFAAVREGERRRRQPGAEPRHSP